MSKHFCPAGKINCDRRFENGTGLNCWFSSGGRETYGFEVCPWPSKQKPIEDKRIEHFRHMPFVSDSNHNSYHAFLSKKLNEVIDRLNELGVTHDTDS